MIKIFQPHLPNFKDVYPLLEVCEDRQIYSNNGPFTQEFEKKLVTHFQVDSGCACAMTNGTLALVAGLKTLNLPPDATCLIPSWTFTATPAAAKILGLKIIFCDVDPYSMMLSPAFVKEILKTHPIDVVIPVSAFGAPVNVFEWDKFTKNTGIPVIIDGAASFDKASVGYTPIMLSLHATKIFGIGEGGILLSTNKNFIQKASQYSNFGFSSGTRISDTEGINARLNEIMASIGLVALTKWNATRKLYQKVWELYAPYLKNNPHFHVQPGFGTQWLSTNLNILLQKPYRDELINYLAKHDIESRSWWGNGCHHMPAYKNLKCLDLSTTNALAKHVLALPFHTQLKNKNVEKICAVLEKFFTQ